MAMATIMEQCLYPLAGKTKLKRWEIKMLINFSKKIFWCLFFSFFLTNLANASLLIKPFRAVLNEKTRTAEITLLNNSKETKTYNILWEDKIQTPQGGYENIENYQFSASEFIRHSPRKVTIAPGEYQKIKLRLRMPKDLPEGEYRSHLMMKAVANSHLPEIDDSNTKGMKMVIYPQLSFTIPIMVRKGKLETSASINSIEVEQGKDNKPALNVQLSHTGDYSSYGSLFAYMKMGNSKVEQIGEAHNVALFRETKKRKANIQLQIPSIPKGAVVQVLYKGADEFEGKILDKAAIRY